MEENTQIPAGDFYAMNLIWQMRIYDMLTVIGRGVNKEETDSLLELHARGKTLGPPASYEPD